MSIRARLGTIVVTALIAVGVATYVLIRFDAPEWTVYAMATAATAAATYKLLEVLIPAFREPEER